MDTQPAKKKFYKRWWFWAIAIVLLIIIGSSGSSKKNGNQSPASGDQNQQPAQSQQEAIKISAVKLSEEYKANEVAADSKYKGKMLEISGIVDSIGKDILSVPYIALKSYEYAVIDKVQCMFSKNDESKLIDVAQGQQITLRGEVSGKMGNVLVNGCQIVK
ncbi:MAG: hypothetical protein PHT44_00095 [Candidatus Portnoybacteria bacterium]|nr:hypothetical protein [Candidatus Portnoybacteria bacterium]MDD4982979.1 hypothetical protein [Candidatus Portnoybacteria bacterium]